MLRWCVIAAVPRSGSNLLCELLSDLGVMGKPREYLLPEDRETHESDLSIEPSLPPREYLELVHERTASKGLASIKIMNQHWRSASPDEPLHDILDNPQYLYLTRLDRASQAVSWARAMQTSAWMSTAKEAAEPEYDYSLTRSALDWILRDEHNWEAEFSASKVAPLRLHYEALISDPVQAVRSILQHVAITDGIDQAVLSGFEGLHETRLQVQRDEMSQLWMHRFCEDLEHTGASHLLTPEP